MASAAARQLKPTNAVQAVWKGKKFIAVDDTPVRIDPSFVCVTYKGYVFIFGTSGFEYLFHYYEELKAHAGQALDEINANKVYLDDFETLKETVLGNKANIRRLRGILARGHLDYYTVESIQDTITK